MKHNKSKRIPHYTPNAVKGFTLIEFLVASMLAMIVIVAASGTYMITRKLNDSAQERISVQQDIRNASVQIARDARMAGSFGCFSTGDNKVINKVLSNIEAKVEQGKNANDKLVILDPNQKDGYGVRVIDKSIIEKVKLVGLDAPSDGLLFIYGQSATPVEIDDAELLRKTNTAADAAGSTIETLKKLSLQDDSDPLKRALNDNGDVILSTCSAITKLGNKVTLSNASAKVQATKILAYKHNSGEFNISKLHASLYVLGNINRGTQRTWANEKALLRYDLGADGTWQNPQLLATGINDTNGQGMTFTFGYVDSDEASCLDNKETYAFFNNPANNTVGNKIPALAQIRLKYYGNKISQQNGTQADAVTRDYIINATIRGGNTCVNRLNKN